MVDTAIAITAGSGTNVDTRTEATNGNHRQVVVIGDPATNAGVAPVDATTGLVVNNTAALDKGAGTGGSATQRVIVDSSQFSALGAGAMTASQSVTIATDDARIGPVNETAPATDTASSGLNGRLQRIAQRITSMIALLPTALGGSGGLKVDDIFSQYETVSASQTAQAMGATGATGDYLAGVLVFPGTAGCGVVTVLDNATTIGTFAGGGTTALPSLVPFMIPIGLYSVSGAWKVTTGANVTAVGIGKFT